MAEKRKGIYFDGNTRVSGLIKKIGSKRTRIVLDDGSEQLVDSTTETEDSRVASTDTPERLVPTIPLEAFYRKLRRLKGSSKAQFELLHELLNKRHGPKGPVFLAELFRRSVRHAESYANVEESFYPPNRRQRKLKKSDFAKRIVSCLRTSKKLQAAGRTIEFVDYEIFPFRTVRSCCENGKSASRIGSGGMDILLASNSGGSVLPAIGEVKASTETVGPTFALVQSLMYAAQMVTPNQFLRLRKHFPKDFAQVKVNQPKVDLFILLEEPQKKNPKDLDYALSLANNVCKSLSQHLGQISFLSCEIKDNNVTARILTDGRHEKPANDLTPQQTATPSRPICTTN